jgi:leucyl aminopeptidase
MKIKILHRTAPLTKAEMDRLDNLVIALPLRKAARAWPSFPYAATLKQRWQRAGQHRDTTSALTTELPNRRGTRVTFALIKPEINKFELLTLCRSLVGPHLENNPDTVAVHVPVNGHPLHGRVAEAVIAAASAGVADMPRYKRTKEKPCRLKQLHFYGGSEPIVTDRVLAGAAGNNLARSLTALPPNVLTPWEYRTRIQALAQEQGWKMEFFGLTALQRLGAGAFLAVARGSADQDAGIVRLRYDPAGGGAALALVGKGICFDTGGTNLKPAKHMLGMHEDMQGSAVALGTLLALTRLKAPFPVECWLALAQNHIGPRAYKQNDVVTACNGMSIEVIHTDAEGRMVLADTLALASREKPLMIIDYATLTGACIYALGSAYSGAFTNRPDFVPQIVAAGTASGERVWPFPTDDDYDHGLKSEIADVKQCALEGEADHILAARFLNRFVNKDIPWIHLDLSAGNHKGGLAHIPTDITGFGVRFTLHLLFDTGVNRVVQKKD